MNDCEAGSNASPFRGKRILVTGGTGTIGSEVVRQLLTGDPEVVRVLSRDETKQAQLRVELGDDSRVRFLIGDIRDLDRVRCALEGVQVVFHAAALKHVPACEYNPFEAVQTNIVGTQNLIQASRDNHVERLVFVSTDKAVNPVNTMGATKLVAENLVRASQEWNPQTTMSVVRFGNVLGSRGSLLPMVATQARERRRVDLTSRDMTRFMMTIEDAVALVLEAGHRSRQGELTILKMPALRVEDLVEVFVEELCERWGWAPGSVSIVETGVRPGEKLHEELVTLDECQRLSDEGSYYGVAPAPRAQRDVSIRAIPDEFRSDRTHLLERGSIRDLIARSRFFDSLDPFVSTEAMSG